MQIIVNFSVFILIFFLVQILFLRIFKININKLSIIFLFIIFSLFIGIKYFEYNLILNLIVVNLTVLCFYTFVPGILNYGPGLEIIDLIENKKINNKKNLKKFFLKGNISKSVEKRLAINLSSGFIKLKNKNYYLSNHAKIMLNFFNLIRKFFKIKPDAY